MAFSAGRKQGWDLTHLSVKYPWLRVDADTIEEFRSPFQWVDVPPKPKQTHPHHHQQQQHVDDDDNSDASGQSSDIEERKESVRFSLSGRKVAASSPSKTPQRRKTPAVKTKTTYASERGKNCHHQKRQGHQFTTKPPARKLREPHVLSNTATNGHSSVQEKSVPRIPSAGYERAGAIRGASSSSLLLTLPETDALYQALTFPVEQRKRVRKKPKKKPHNILSLRYA